MARATACWRAALTILAEFGDSRARDLRYRIPAVEPA
jgi:hypothetical protein